MAKIHANNNDTLRLSDMESSSALIAAMQQDRTVNFIYEGKVKVVEVHAVGLSTKDGSLIMRGYQVAGTASRPLPVWALYTVGKMELIELGTETSLAPREGYNMGDAQMQPVIAELQL